VLSSAARYNMDKKRIQVYADPDTKRRIELAAARYDVAVTEYCLEAIKQQLAEDDILEEEQIEIPVRKAEKDYIADLRALRQAILADRGRKPIDIDIPALIEQMREERDEQLIGLR
jgi:uncharacterized protein (DUF1778 family)